MQRYPRKHCNWTIEPVIFNKEWLVGGYSKMCGTQRIFNHQLNGLHFLREPFRWPSPCCHKRSRNSEHLPLWSKPYLQISPSALRVRHKYVMAFSSDMKIVTVQLGIDLLGRMLLFLGHKVKLTYMTFPKPSTEVL